MKRIISYLQTISLRQVLTVFMAGITFWVSAAFNDGMQMQAIAEPVTPEATAYQVNHSDARISLGTDKDVEENSQNQKPSVFENIKEKLNLDEPLPRSTKDFLNDVQNPTDNTVDNTVKDTHKGLNDAAKSGNSK